LSEAEAGTTADTDPAPESGADTASDSSSAGGSAATAATVLEYVAKAIVDEPDSVRVETEDGRHGPTLRLHVAQGDMGKVIGRRGRVAQAIRSLVRAAGSRDGTDVQVDIVD
jgi:uncharacterized protein